MWDTVEGNELMAVGHLSHDRPCVRCGHAMHTFLACDDDCGCQPARTPNAVHATHAAVVSVA